MNKFIFIIYFTETLEIITYTYDEDICIRLYGILCQSLGSSFIDWRAFSLDSILEKFLPHSLFMKGQ